MWEGWGTDTWVGWENMGGGGGPVTPDFSRFVRPISVDIEQEIDNDIGAE